MNNIYDDSLDDNVYETLLGDGDEDIIGDLRKEILANREKPTVSERQFLSEYEALLARGEIIQAEAKLPPDPEVKVYKRISEVVEKPRPRRVPRKWFAPFYYTYLKIKSTIKEIMR